MNIEFKLVRKEPSIETERLYLRKFELSDAEAVVNRGWYNRKKQQPINTLLRAKNFLKSDILNQDDGYYLGVFLKENDALIGDVDMCHFSWYRDTCAELCYGFAERYWGKGYATEASAGIIDYMFREVKLNKITADTDPDNIASQRVLEKLGFTQEGIARQKNWKKNKFIDEFNYGLLRNEWLKAHKKQLYKKR
ncbi:GNAT family N-acetyltransferase [Candidatus Woesearchaeota archaeon]|nr:GNAT family N-acetyltransferase [Candidatus Woesearchaeota archaeon]